MIAAITRKADRQAFDRYCTASWFTSELLKNHPITGVVLECCNGNSDISKILEGFGLSVETNDIDTELVADYHEDVSKIESWYRLNPVPWVISNPPFNVADQIIPLAYEHCTTGLAMLLRCTWLESTMTGNKARWLSEHPPSQIISLPRFAFSRSPKTGKYGTDSCPAWWFVWRKDGYKPEQPIVIVPHTDIDGFCRKPIED